MQKIVERICIACKNKHPQSEMIRVVKNKNGEISFQVKNKLMGRGAYICKDSKCLELVKKKKLLNRTFKQNIDDKIYEELNKNNE